MLAFHRWWIRGHGREIAAITATTLIMAGAAGAALELAPALARALGLALGLAP